MVHATDAGGGQGVAAPGVAVHVAVSTDDPPVTPTGSVQLRWGGDTVATVPLDGRGTADRTLSNLPVGAGPLTAVYGGASDVAGSPADAPPRVGFDPTPTTI